MAIISEKYKCIIFDCDGVLVDSEPLGNKVMVEMANEFGAAIDLDYAYRYFKGNSLYRCMQHIEKLIAAELPDDFEFNYRRRSFELFKKEIQPVQHIKHIIKTLETPYCVASSGPLHKIELNLRLTGLLHYFDNRIFSCYQIQKWKPDPSIFLWAIETMGFKPEECVVIEDSIMGVEAAKNGGFDVFAYVADDYNDEIVSMATKSFDSMLKLPELL